ncbi:MAG: peptidoglycan-binding domain-containing protein, partial [Pontibacterium sp.]
MSNTAKESAERNFSFDGPDQNRKVRGKLVNLEGGQRISGAQVALFGVVQTDQEAMLVSSGRTDQDGNFSIAYPKGKFREAFLVSSLSPDEQVRIQLRPDASFPDFAYGALSDAVMPDEEDCGCSGSNDTPRLPDESDFAFSDTYSQDIGSSCVNFTTPNRALEEFSYYSIVRLTDPTVNLTPEFINDRLATIEREIVMLQRQLQEHTGGTKGGKVSGAAKTKAPDLEAMELTDDAMLYSGSGHQAVWKDDYRNQMILALMKEREHLLRTGRREVSSTSPINWDTEDTLDTQAASISHGHLLHFKQVWRADGYSLGDLVYSLPLAPGQKKRIAILDWDREETASRIEGQTQEERLSNSMIHDRDINEIVNSVLTESMSASSQSKVKTKGFSIGASVSTPTPVSVGVSGGYSSQTSQGSSSAQQDSARRLAASNMQAVRDKTMQSASSVRSQRSSVVTTVGQNESMSVQTEVIANYNHCHAITIQYFEVLRHFALHTELADVQECLFIPMQMMPFDRDKAARWQDSLKPWLFGSYEQIDTYQKGLDACVREVEADKAPGSDPYGDFPTGTFASEKIGELWGTVRVRVHLERPDEIYPDAMGPTDPIFGVAPTEMMLSAALINNPVDRDNWEKQLGFIDNWESLRRKVYSVPAADRDQVFREAINSIDYAHQIISKLSFWLYRASHNHPSQRFTPDFRETSKQRPHWQKSRIGAVLSKGSVHEFTFHHDMHFQVDRDRVKGIRFVAQNTETGDYMQLPAGSYFKVESLNVQYKTDHYSDYLIQASGMSDDMNKQIALLYDTPLNKEETRNMREEYQAARTTVLRHLNENLVHYHKILWSSMDPDKRLMMLEGFHVEVPARQLPGSTTETPAQMRALPSVVENKIVAVVGNSIVMPVAKGYNLNPYFRFDDDLVQMDDGTEVSRLHHHYMPGEYFQSSPYRISVPTQGVFAEAVKGACNSCEKIDDTRFWNWQESPIPDDTTEIMPISMDSRRADPGDLTAKDFAQPMVNIQNAPSVPDPTGLSAALELIGKGDAFKDITGLSDTQKNVLAAMGINSETLQASMDNATRMAMQQAALRHSENIEQKIRNSGLPKEKRDQLMQAHLERLVTGESDTNSIGGGAISGGQSTSDSTLFDGDGEISRLIQANKGKITRFDAQAESGESISFEAEQPLEEAASSVEVPNPDPYRDRNTWRYLTSQHFTMVGPEMARQFYWLYNVRIGVDMHETFIHIGDANSGVLKVQEVLDFVYPNENISLDGYFGEETRDLVERLQSDFAGCHISRIEGIVGPETLRLMDMIMAASERSPNKSSADIIAEIQAQCALEDRLKQDTRTSIVVANQGFEKVFGDVATIMRLANSGYYSNMSWHRYVVFESFGAEGLGVEQVELGVAHPELRVRKAADGIGLHAVLLRGRAYAQTMFVEDFDNVIRAGIGIAAHAVERVVMHAGGVRAPVHVEVGRLLPVDLAEVGVRIDENAAAAGQSRAAEVRLLVEVHRVR